MQGSEVEPTYNPSRYQRILHGGGIRDGGASISRLVAICTIASCLITGIVFAAGKTTTTATQIVSARGLGSVDDYMQSKSYEPSNPDDPYKSALLGIGVKSGTGELEDGRTARGVEILTVISGSPGGAAGLQGSSPGALRGTALFIGMVAGAALFPPALMLVMALSKIGEPHETIIAVDGERIRDVTEFEEALEKADAGEVVYLTVVSGGRREQIQVALPVQ
jgi:S1-C subfamily serine protease